MTRKSFLKYLATLGIGAPLLATLASCSKDEALPDISTNFQGKVLIIGAGAAGITAGYILQRYGIDFQIIEASSIYGGRLKKLEGFADFPIDLGGEWIHTDPSILSKLLDDSSIDESIELINYQPKTIHIWKGENLRKRNITSDFYREYKFKNTTWFDFFDRYMMPEISDRIIYNSPISSIDYTGDKVLVKDTNETTYEGDKVLVTVPLSILKSDLITFQPALPESKTSALDTVDFPPILKVFMSFSERFYSDMVIMDGFFEREELFYDAAFGKDSEENILGLFVIGEPAEAYAFLESDQAIIDAVLEKLDDIYAGRPSDLFQKAVVQNWTQEPFIQGSYSHFESSGYSSTVETLAEPLEDKVYFAGEAMAPNDNTSTVHGASESAYWALNRMLTD
ncbi:MAG: NAD(P)/FAD-dependent oxidoreductase [Bacteroidota bacterium]